MAVVEAEALSGFTFDGEATRGLVALPDLQRAELAKGDTLVNLYFDKVLVSLLPTELAVVEKGKRQVTTKL